MFRKCTKSLFSENGLFIEQAYWSTEGKNGNNIIHLLCQAAKNTLVNIS